MERHYASRRGYLLRLGRAEILHGDGRLSWREARQLSLAKQRRVPVSVPSDSMLSLGAMISMTTQASDIAATIANVVRMIQSGDINRVPPITQLSEIRVKTKGAEQVVRR